MPPPNDPVQPWKVWAALGTVYVVWGSTYLAIAVAVETMPPLLFAGVRFLIAGLILFVATSGRKRKPLTRSHWLTASVVGIALLLGGNGGVVVAEKTVSSGVASLMVAAIPLWFAIFARIILKESITTRVLVGILVGFGGIALLTLPSGPQQVDRFGALLLFFSPIWWAAGSLYSKKRKSPDPPVLGTALQMLVGGLALLLAGALRGEIQELDIQAVSTRSWIAFVYLVFVGSLLAFTAYIWLLDNASTSLVATYAYVNPIVAVFLGWLILDETVSSLMLVAAAVIVGGVALIVSSSKPDDIELGSPADAPAALEHDG